MFDNYRHPLWTRGRHKCQLTPCIFTDYWGCGKFVLYDNYDLHKHEYFQTTILYKGGVFESVSSRIDTQPEPPDGQAVIQLSSVASEFVHILHSSAKQL